MAKTLQNGSFQDPVGAAVNAGTVEFVLSQDAAIIAGGQVAPTRVSAVLDANGDMPGGFTILANDELTPSGTFYLTTVFDSNGARVFGPERWVLSGASPIDLDTLIPTIVDPAFANPILSNPAAAQVINDFDLSLPLLNNIRWVDGTKFTTIQGALDDAGAVVVIVPDDYAGAEETSVGATQVILDFRGGRLRIRGKGVVGAFSALGGYSGSSNTNSLQTIILGSSSAPSTIGDAPLIVQKFSSLTGESGVQINPAIYGAAAKSTTASLDRVTGIFGVAIDNAGGSGWIRRGR